MGQPAEEFVPRPVNLLVVDDNPQARELFSRYLAPHEIRVQEASDLASAVDGVLRATFDAVFIDCVLVPWTQPEAARNGIEVCRAVRAAGETAPIWMYSAVLRSATTLIAALEAGADEFIESPLENLDQLVARIRAMRRRRDWSHASPPVEVGRIAVDFALRVAKVSGVPMMLTRSEFALLSYLAARRDRSVSHEDLYRDVLQSPERARASNALTMLVQRLRKKLGEGAAQLETVRGFGYRLTSDS